MQCKREASFYYQPRDDIGHETQQLLGSPAQFFYFTPISLALVHQLAASFASVKSCCHVNIHFQRLHSLICSPVGLLSAAQPALIKLSALIPSPGHSSTKSAAPFSLPPAYKLCISVMMHFFAGCSDEIFLKRLFIYL